MSLLKKKCKPCEGGTKPLEGKELEKLIKEVGEHWQLLEDGKKIQRKFEFRSFKEAFVFLMGLAHLAEAEGHHPDIFNSWNKVDLTLWTHAIGGLSENDFILAAKIDEMFEKEFS